MKKEKKNWFFFDSTNIMSKESTISLYFVNKSKIMKITVTNKLQ